ncbi:MAG: hypothetical protein RL556_148 [Actinomycetota bacterium]|jgi:predicted dehydrogenase
MTNTYRWGYLAASGIAHSMAADFALAGLKIQAVGARDIDRANEFADKFDIPTRHGSYEALVNDPEVDIVYVSTVHTMHFEHALLAINAGKHVLVEKPFTVTSAQAQKLHKAATAGKVMVLEAMWTRFLPSHLKLQELIEAGTIGQVKLVTADHSQALQHASRLWDPAVAGGALLDLGIYPVSFSYRILGQPNEIAAKAQLTELGVDELTSAIFEYESGAQAVFTTCMSVAGPVNAVVTGTKGRVELEKSFYNNTAWVAFDNNDNEIARYVPAHEGRGMQYQALHFEECLRQGLLTSPILPLSESVQIMQTLDAIRSQIGVRYAGE